MGVPKAGLLFRGHPLLSRVIDSMRPGTSEVIVVIAPGQAHQAIEATQTRVVEDREPDAGPLMALHSGLAASRGTLNWVVACDMPFVNAEMLAMLAVVMDGYDAALPVSAGVPQPLHAVYAASCLPALEKLLDSGVRRLTDLAGAVRTRYVHESEWSHFSPDSRAFLSVDTPSQLVAAEQM
jgi:molybdopterin-guanine dinucleotide biosynthesis protein A